MTTRVLVADDDRAIRESLERALELEGFAVELAVDGIDALARLRAHTFDVLVLDLRMPRLDGLGVCRLLRADQDRTPVLVLTARVGSAVTGLSAGADDHLPKPFDLDELLARLRALLRRASLSPAAAPTVLRAGGLVIDLAGRGVTWHETELALTRIEFDLLALLTRHAGTVLAAPALYQRIWGYDFGPRSKNLAVRVSGLRRKLAAAGAPPLIHTVPGEGYLLRPPLSDAVDPWIPAAG